MVCRNPEKCKNAASLISETIPDAKIDIMIVDLASLKAVEKLASTVNEKYDSLEHIGE